MEMKNSNWLITGGCGFIGTNVISHLSQHTHAAIRVIDSFVVGTPDDLGNVCSFERAERPTKFRPNHVELIQGDIRDLDLAMAAAEGANVILHLAANTGVGPSVEAPMDDCLNNVIGTVNYLEAARLKSVDQFIFASSGAPVGECQPPIHEELPPHPVSPYGASKLAGEGYCSAYWNSFGIKTVALRFGNVYGPGSTHKASVVAKFIKLALQNEPCAIYGDGSQTRDFIFIDDLVEAIMLSSQIEAGGEAFQIATNKEHSVLEIAELIEKQLEQIANIQPQFIHEEARIGDVTRNYSDTSKAKNVLGWEAKYNVNEGLEKTIKYFLNE